MSDRPPKRYIPNFTAEAKPLREQLIAFAEDLMKEARANFHDPRKYEPAVKTILSIGDKLGSWGNTTPLDTPKEQHVDTSEFED